MATMTLKTASGDLTLNPGGDIQISGTIATGVWQGTDIGVAYGGTGVSTLTANGVLIGNGTSAIGAIDMSTKGHVLIGDGSGNPQMLGVGTNTHVLTADSGETTGVKWAAPVGAVTREGGNTTEATTTSTTMIDLLTVASLSIAAAIPIWTLLNIRKTAGAVGRATTEFRYNTTSISNLYTFSTTNQAEDFLVSLLLGARVTNYLDVGINSILTSSGQGTYNFNHSEHSAPTATITDVVFRADSDSASITIGADEAHVYSLATS
jgi:hypothetical protein